MSCGHLIISLLLICLELLIGTLVTQGIPRSAYGIPFGNPQILPTKSKFPLLRSSSKLLVGTPEKELTGSPFLVTQGIPGSAYGIHFRNPQTLPWLQPNLNFCSFKLLAATIEKELIRIVLI